MDKKKFLFATLFVAIMLLVPFTAVGTQPVDYAKESEDNEILEKASPSPVRPLCFMFRTLYDISANAYDVWNPECWGTKSLVSCILAELHYFIMNLAWDIYYGLGCSDCV